MSLEYEDEQCHTIFVMETEGNDIVISRDVLGGTPVFQGTRVPVQTLIDYLEAGDDIDDFLGDFPTVERDQVIHVLERFKTILLEHPYEKTAA